MPFDGNWPGMALLLPFFLIVAILFGVYFHRLGYADAMKTREPRRRMDGHFREMRGGYVLLVYDGKREARLVEK